MSGLMLVSRGKTRSYKCHRQRGHQKSSTAASGNNPQPQETSTLAMAPLYSSLTTQEEMVNYLTAQGIRLQNFTYHFKIFNGERHLIDSSEGLILPFYLLEVGFHLLLHPFFYTVLEEYEIMLRQLTNLYWWTLVVYFLDWFRGDPSGRTLAENVIDASIEIVSPTYPLMPSQPFQPKFMHIKALMESAQRAVEAINARILASSSSCKRPRFKKRSSTIPKLPTDSTNVVDLFASNSVPLLAS
ncbi:hypothetical protein J1N35_000983 [Gossypium stocksii]|uniref:Uncharacterized protein n=1 Tax=Gossypium stocksii TaxID=47602 RepID=A0A9D3WIP5_9ROSI|nr:hypothetical protein J1N35_000983 [Gossypium stocksii]